MTVYCAGVPVCFQVCSGCKLEDDPNDKATEFKSLALANLTYIIQIISQHNVLVVCLVYRLKAIVFGHDLLKF